MKLEPAFALAVLLAAGSARAERLPPPSMGTQPAGVEPAAVPAAEPAPAAAPQAEPAPAPEAPAKAEPAPAPAPEKAAPAEAPVRLIPEAPAPKAAPKAAAKAKGPSRDELAEAHLAYLRKANLDADRRMVETYLNDLNSFLAAYRDEAGADEVLALRAALRQRAKDWPGEAVDRLKLIYEYPDSRFIADAKARVAELSQGKLKKDADGLQKLLAGPSLDAARPERCAQLLSALGSFEDPQFIAPLRSELAEFIARYPDQAGADQIQLLAARNEVLAGEDAPAAYAYGKFLALYADSPARPGVLYALGELQQKRLRDYEGALATYGDLTDKYPDSPAALAAYERVAELQETRFKRYSEAVAAYEEVVKRLPKQEAAQKALANIARLYRERMSLYDLSIKTYERLDAMFPGAAGLSALGEASYVSGRELKDYPRQIALLQRIAKQYPERAEAPEALFDAAGIYEDRLHDLSSSVAVYSDLATRFPQSKYASKAQSRIERIKKSQAPSK